MAEDAIEFVEVALVFHQGRAGEIIEFVDAIGGDIALHRLHQGQEFLERDRQFRVALARGGTLRASGTVFAAVQESKPLEELHILLVFEERAV